ncbi:MAG: T9SS type A sorting domain-containing protein [Bacteroidia bacterium]|nr:T9SS type A sorting domain-containing protein [Bacteroidia bacterium]
MSRKVLAVLPEDYYSLTELTHDYMTAKNQTSKETTKFALAMLTINSNYGNTISLTVGDSGPFEVNNGLASKSQLPANDEIFTRTAVASPSELPVEEFEGGTIKLYPNPTQGVVTIEINLPEPSPVGVKIFNAVGDVVYDEETYSNAGLQSMIVDVKKTSGPGIIFVSITTSRGQRLVKLLVE